MQRNGEMKEGNHLSPPSFRVSQGFWRTREHWQNIEGNEGTLANFWEQGNKIRKITVRKHSERVWEHGNIGQFWKGTREQGPPLGDPPLSSPFSFAFLDFSPPPPPPLLCLLFKLEFEGFYSTYCFKLVPC